MAKTRSSASAGDSSKKGLTGGGVVDNNLRRSRAHDYIGIDPGASGGIARIDWQGVVVRVQPMPATEREIYDALEEEGRGSFATLERVSAWPRMGAVSAFTFGRGFGGLIMALVAQHVAFELVTPAKWQGAMGCLSARDKNVTKRRAQHLFPKLTVTHAIADALLIAEYGRRMALGLNWRK